jgi:hypothetical protein
MMGIVMMGIARNYSEIANLENRRFLFYAGFRGIFVV